MEADSHHVSLMPCCYRMETDSRRAFTDITSHLRPSATSVERRLQSIQQELQDERSAKQLGKISSQLQQVLNFIIHDDILP